MIVVTLAARWIVMLAVGMAVIMAVIITVSVAVGYASNDSSDGCSILACSCDFAAAEVIGFETRPETANGVSRDRSATKPISHTTCAQHQNRLD